MAATTIANVVVPEVYDDYFMENSIYKSALYRSGIVVKNPQMDEMLRGGASMFSLPFWQGNTVRNTSATPVNEGDTLTPANITGSKMVARRQYREKAWGQNDVAAILAGDSPEEAIMSLIEEFWNLNFQKHLFYSVLGVIADNVANDGGDLSNTPGAVIDSDNIIDTIMKFGDMTEDIAAIAMHSTPYGALQKANLIDTDPDNTQNIGWGTYLGKTVIVDDMLVSGGVYKTIIFKPGAFAFGESFENYLPTEVDRAPAQSGGQSLLYTRRVYLIHPSGFAWQETAAVTTTFPTDTNLQSADEWNRVVASPKNCGFAVLSTTG